MNGKYECTLCGAELDVAADKVPVALIKASSGTPSMRTISVDGKEIHRCPIDPGAK
jgi:hypothetical protein